MLYVPNLAIQQLYQLAYDCQELDKVHSSNFIGAMNIACYSQSRILDKAKKSLKDVPGASKTIKIIDRGLEYNARLKCKFSTMVEMDGSSDTSLDIPTKLLLGNAAGSAGSTSTYEAERAFVHDF
ncbi:hypothetical protein DFQ28_003528 [Apophysomyces sp. BC1034]|nr:hypothetical protein DFQ30_003487 [Apophysomyces sp. BC1015]KAG0189360.1 hypothetical protein DFQ28_003528 [Apophysomyces sp. BC1034]